MTSKEVNEVDVEIVRNANDHFGNPMGTGNFYQIRGKKFVFTDGVKDLCNDCECFWFMDVILSYQGEKKVKSEEFQVWTLERIKDDRFKVTMDDGNENIILKQLIPFSDFKYDLATVWVEYNTLLLPCER